MVERLITSPERSARAALDEIVRRARYDCAAFGTDLAYDDPVWDVTRSCPRPSNKSHKAARIYFTTHEAGTSKNMNGRTPLGEPFCALVKAIVRLKQDARPQTADPLIAIVHASRDLGEELQSRDHDPCMLLKEDFDAAARRVVSRSGGARSYRLGVALEQIARFIDKHGITPMRLDWKNTISKASNARDRTSDLAVTARAEKIPTAEVFDALAEIWQKIEKPSDIILMSCIVLLHCAPWRIIEVLRIAYDCEVEEQKEGPDGPVFDREGMPVMRYGIRYWKEKSGDPDIKWIPTVMVDVARSAIERMRQATSGAHELAVWLQNNPGRAWLPSETGQRADGDLSVKDVQRILGFAAPSAALLWLNSNNVALTDQTYASERFGTKFRKVVERKRLEAALLGRMPVVAEGKGEAPLHKRLFVNFANEHHARHCTNPCLLEITSDQQVRDFLGGRRDNGKTGVRSGFSRLLDRPHLSAQTHQFRHWLNTLAQSGGLEQQLIARWSGRDDLEQNAEYDHLTPTQLAETMREPLAKGMALGVLADIHVKLEPVEREAFREVIIATAHVTEIGFCIHDWNTAPCPESEPVRPVPHSSSSRETRSISVEPRRCTSTLRGSSNDSKSRWTRAREEHPVTIARCAISSTASAASSPSTMIPASRTARSSSRTARRRSKSNRQGTWRHDGVKTMGRSRIAITAERKEKIVALIEGWTTEWGRLTGPTLEARVEAYLGWKLSRIGMFKHAEIETAFEKRRIGLDEGKPPRKRRPVHEEVTAQRITRLESEAVALSRKVDNLLEMIARHHFNAQRRGMTIADLEAPLNQARGETQFPNAGKKKR